MSVLASPESGITKLLVDADTETEYDRFDGMIATYFDFLDRRERLYRWADGNDDVDDLETATRRLLDATVREYGG